MKIKKEDLKIKVEDNDDAEKKKTEKEALQWRLLAAQQEINELRQLQSGRYPLPQQAPIYPNCPLELKENDLVVCKSCRLPLSTHEGRQNWSHSLHHKNRKWERGEAYRAPCSQGMKDFQQMEEGLERKGGKAGVEDEEVGQGEGEDNKLVRALIRQAVQELGGEDGQDFRKVVERAQDLLYDELFSRGEGAVDLPLPGSVRAFHLLEGMLERIP